jgi:hypothetical protein
MDRQAAEILIGGAIASPAYIRSAGRFIASKSTDARRRAGFSGLCDC